MLFCPETFTLLPALSLVKACNRLNPRLLSLHLLVNVIFVHHLTCLRHVRHFCVLFIFFNYRLPVSLRCTLHPQLHSHSWEIVVNTKNACIDKFLSKIRFKHYTSNLQTAQTTILMNTVISWAQNRSIKFLKLRTNPHLRRFLNISSSAWNIYLTCWGWSGRLVMLLGNCFVCVKHNRICFY